MVVIHQFWGVTGKSKSALLPAFLLHGKAYPALVKVFLNASYDCLSSSRHLVSVRSRQYPKSMTAPITNGSFIDDVFLEAASLANCNARNSLFSQK